MTKTQTLLAIRAYADGWKIECRSFETGKWTPVELPGFNEIREYRVVPDENGWLPWYGGECPINPNVMVAVKYQGGGTCTQTAGKLHWRNDSSIYAYVTAYRIVEEEKADPYAELKAAAKDSTKQMRLRGSKVWADGTAFCFDEPPENYEIRNKPQRMKLLAWVNPIYGSIAWGNEMPPDWKRVPSEDKEIEVEE